MARVRKASTTLSKPVRTKTPMPTSAAPMSGLAICEVRVNKSRRATIACREPYRCAQCRTRARRPDRSEQHAQRELAADPGWPKSIDPRLAADCNGPGDERKPVLKRWNQKNDADDQDQGGDA